MADSALRAGTVASNVAGGTRHVSQLPQGALDSPK
jgi:hypothetical protein